YQVAKRIIRVPYISMANILSGREIVKEYIQEKATPRVISGHVLSFLQNPDKLDAQRKELLSLRHILGDKGASGRTADIILKSCGKMSSS
ncbi:MAG: lipid-A-disaccharide synthase, partial [Deltaproteobacteria bacterium]|nr:lipid-A-disaccharide synthase [Deltaproteobacteria bacterium]